MALNDLTSLANTAAWLNISSSTPNSILQRLISATSQQALECMNRSSFLSQTYTDTYNGNGGSTMILRHWPVTSITQVVVDNAIIPAAPLNSPTAQPTYYNGTAGWRIELWDGTLPGKPGKLEIPGYYFRKGLNNVTITYTAGYLKTETDLIPSSPYQVTLVQSLGSWIGDNGVVYGSTGSATPGSSLTHISSGTPLLGQYTYTAGTYTFSAADNAAGNSAAISYSFCPFSVEQAILDWINNIYARRQRPGLKSKGLVSQESMSFDLSGVPQYVAEALMNYTNVGAQ